MTVTKCSKCKGDAVNSSDGMCNQCSEDYWGSIEEEKLSHTKKQIGNAKWGKKKCKACLGYGFWAWSHIAPMGQMDAEDGVTTCRCPECGANPNPSRLKSKERDTELQEIYDRGLLKFGEAKDHEEFMKVWTKINKGKYI